MSGLNVRQAKTWGIWNDKKVMRLTCPRTKFLQLSSEMMKAKEISMWCCTGFSYYKPQSRLFQWAFSPLLSPNKEGKWCRYEGSHISFLSLFRQLQEILWLCFCSRRKWGHFEWSTVVKTLWSAALNWQVSLNPAKATSSKGFLLVCPFFLILYVQRPIWKYFNATGQCFVCKNEQKNVQAIIFVWRKRMRERKGNKSSSPSITEGNFFPFLVVSIFIFLDWKKANGCRKLFPIPIWGCPIY